MFQPDFSAHRQQHGLHPFDIEHPAEYNLIQDVDLDMKPFDSWEFCFDNGWGASVLDAHNDGYEPGQRWIFDFVAWETVRGAKVLHLARHREIDALLGLTPLTTEQVSDYLHKVCRFEDRTHAASNSSTCYTCRKWIRRIDEIAWDNRNRPYHAHCR